MSPIDFLLYDGGPNQEAMQDTLLVRDSKHFYSIINYYYDDIAQQMVLEIKKHKKDNRSRAYPLG